MRYIRKKYCYQYVNDLLICNADGSYVDCTGQPKKPKYNMKYEQLQNNGIYVDFVSVKYYQ